MYTSPGLKGLRNCQPVCRAERERKKEEKTFDFQRLYFEKKKDTEKGERFRKKLYEYIALKKQKKCDLSSHFKTCIS